MPNAYSQEKQNEIVLAWDRGLTIKNICRQIGTKSMVTVANYIRASGREMPMGRSRNRIYQLNHNAFASLSDEAAYWVGFIVADGCVTAKWHLILGLSDRDEAHLQKLKLFLNSDAPIKHRKMRYGSGCLLQISSKRLVMRLNELGVVPAKSHIAYAPPELADNLHFWRGMIDGDGHISKNSKVVELCGTAEICNSFALFVSRKFGGWPEIISPHSSIFRVRYSTKTTAKILKLLYDCDGCTSLDRKQHLAQAVF